MLRFNTFRQGRFLRSKFVEGKYLLASEATDLELEVLDLLRKVVRETMGEAVAVEDAWKIKRLNATQILIEPGQAWVKGLPFSFRDGKDQLVSGAILSIGTVPVGAVVTDDANGLGKIVTFNSAATTPTNLYRVVITAKEELITEVDDPFLQNVNLTESTAQKIRLNYQLNIVPDSLQTESPIPYRDETSSSGSVTNFPNSGGQAAPNFVNQTVVTPTLAGNGHLVALNVISGSEGIDGRDLELVIRNDPALSGGRFLPNSPTTQAAYSNGKLIDSHGNMYHVNTVFNDTVSTQVVIRIDKEPDQPNPEIVDTIPYTIIKRDVFVTDDSNGSPQGRLNYPIATINWNSTSGFVHDSVVTDLRIVVSRQDVQQVLSEEKFTLNTVGGGTFNLGLDAATLSWDAAVNLISPSTQIQTIAAGSAYLIANGFVIYELDLDTAASIQKGNLSVTTTSSGTTISMSGSPDLSLVSKGNIIVVGTDAAQILTIDNVNKVLTVTPSLPSSGAATIYRDSYAPNTYVTGPNTYVFASRTGNVVWVDNKLALAAGQSAKLGVPSAAGINKVTAYDPTSTTLPSGASAVIDGYTVVNGDSVLFSNLSSGNNRVYQVSGVGTSIVWTAIGTFAGQLDPTTGDLVIFTQGTEFKNQIAEYTGSTFAINNPVRYFTGANYWEQSALQTSTLSNNTTGDIFSVTALGSENMVIDFSINRGGIKETGTLWLTNDASANAWLASGGSAGAATGVSFSATVSAGNVILSYTTTNTGSSATFKYVVRRWSDAAGGPTGLPSYAPDTASIYGAAFLMSDNSGTPINCINAFNVSGKTRIQLNFNYMLSRNSGSPAGDLDVYVNGQRFPRFISGATLDGFYKEISTNTIEFHTDLTVVAQSIEIVKKV